MSHLDEEPRARLGREGRVIHQRGYGQAHLEWNAPITPQTVFHAASLAKQFTALSVSLLVEQGKLAGEIGLEPDHRLVGGRAQGRVPRFELAAHLAGGSRAVRGEPERARSAETPAPVPA